MDRADGVTDVDVPSTFATLWRLLMGSPHLLGEHAAGYAALVRDEGARSLHLVLRQLQLQALLLGSVTASLVLAGVALMLWSGGPAALPARAWVLLVVPLLPLVVAAWALYAGRSIGPLPLWAAWQRQVAADAELLQRQAAP
jgi:hypothetical protein